MIWVRKSTAWMLCVAAALGLAACGARDEADAIDRLLRKQCHEWRGLLTWQDEDGEVRSQRMRYYLESNGTEAEYRGRLEVQTPGEGAEGTARLLEVTYALRDGLWTGRIGDADGFVARVPRTLDESADGERALEKRSVSWAGAGGHFSMRLDHEAIHLAIDGMLPLSQDVAPGAQWMSARLERDAFRFSIGPFAITLMECLGIFATLFFASRFIIQWAASERAGRSVMPEIFWWVSLIGSGLMLVYAIYFGRLAVLLGQLFGWTVYCRNIYLIEREKRQKRQAAEQETLESERAPEAVPGHPGEGIPDE